ncbi:hypothetical protein L596_019098 [Steinernema carpocapsae]|uniref:ER membrane protein complex subunit 7 beta-sandwich domain-containing protein n=1 Tax=Steinernema carpocapsae TaxID=34508 RepID=A0A4U5N8J1_STECR|nr:hypothetical protein L596_019098 [Steinernema carpocapsae]
MTLNWAPQVLLLLCAVGAIVKANVYTCGGFVKSDVPIDYSQIRVKLLTPEGNLKTDVDVTPNNGYYMIPVYSKAQYEIRVSAPEGWIFEPAAISVKIDGETDMCSQGKDMNFVLSGFAIQGHVKSGESGGPEGIPLTLSTEGGQVVAETETRVGGSYSFNAKPGRYLVATSDHSSQCIERGQTVVEVKDKPVVAKPDLKISGHRLSFLVSNKGIPVGGVSVVATSDSGFGSQAKCLAQPKEVVVGGKSVCTLVTGSNGIATLPCSPPGKYSAQAFYKSSKDESVRFEFKPNTLDFEMLSEAKLVPFEVTGFATRGRIVAGGKSVQNARVKVNGELTEAVTDETGAFELRLAEGTHTFEIEKEDMEFPSVSKELSMSKALIGDIVASKINVCGSVQLDDDDGTEVKVHFIDKSGKRITTKTTGKFCMKLAPGTYIITAEVASGVVVTPKSHEVSLTSEPLKGITFTQFTASATVALKCIGDCSDVSVELTGSTGLSKREKGKASITFTGLSPDSYKLRVIDNDQFCWEKSELNFAIERSDVKDLVFVQSGFRSIISLFHAGKITWKKSLENAVSGTFDGVQGENKFCVPSTGSYLVSVESCHQFARPEYTFTVPVKERLTITAAKSAVSAIIKTKHAVLKSDITLLIKTSEGNETVAVSSTISDKEYEFKFFVPQNLKGSEVTIVPQSSDYLFAPTSSSFKFSGSCQFSIATFEADKGMYLEGKVEPAVGGVQISAPHKTDANLVFKAVTDSNGKYKIGPVRKLEDFYVSAELEGYKFAATNNQGVFKTVKLSQLKIVAVDSMSSKPLADVLVSLSGVDNYRSNNIIDKTGKINFVGLAPGQYFLRPFLQEYDFEPKMIPVTIREGEEEELKLAGVQVAYSIFGKVTQIAGEPVPSVSVEAVSEQCQNLQAEDVTAADGSYRLRGLQPKCLYRMALKDQQGNRLESYPSHYDVEVQNDNVFKKNYFLSYMEKQMEIFGTVDFLGGVKPPNHYHIGLYKDDEYVHRTTVTWPSTIFFFANLSVDGSEYSVRLESEGVPSLERSDSSKMTFVADRTFKAVKLVVQPHRRSADLEIPRSSLAGLLLLAVITFVIFNHSKIIPYALSITQAVMERLEAGRMVGGTNGQNSSGRSKPRK